MHWRYPWRPSHASTAVSTGSIPVQGTKIQVLPGTAKKEEEKKKKASYIYFNH